MKTGKESFRKVLRSMTAPSSFLAVSNDSEIVNLRLSQLPFIGKKDLLDGLAKYGEVLDVGMYVEPVTKTYMCTGYASINLKAKYSAEPIKPLTHLIPWFDSCFGSFQAVWKSMASYCRYCHAEGHVLSDCPKRLVGMTCYNCREKGHIAASCRRNLQSKKPRKTTFAPEDFDFSYKANSSIKHP
ncbi:hypothetical protein BDB01DRAFT_795841 [Pilobolus umbonatus]|nr:hypothetical protein BDB01DRAFT_795841 [Pilobolus umbonatus]